MGRAFYDPRVTVHAYVPSNGIRRGFAFKYGKFLLPPRFLAALSVPKMPAHKQPPLSSMPSFLIRPTLCPFLTNFITFPIFIIL